ncbi:MAG: hypothetical protein HQM10_03785 [Candidatus Riflebacteria bacterium]|nr:hypothetical protein [Candidatus Riflebacteria bacterium]
MNQEILKKWADKLNGREYGKSYSILSKEEIEEAKNDKVIIFCGASDDLLELEGFISEEFGAGYYSGAEVYFDDNMKLLKNKCDNEDCPYFLEIQKTAKKVSMSGMPWKFTTDIPHEKFEIFEEGELYGEGIVISGVPNV